MTRRANPDRKNTTIGGVPKSLKLRIRKFAKKDPNRSGTESDAKILERMVKFYESNNRPESDIPVATYNPKIV